MSENETKKQNLLRYQYNCLLNAKTSKKLRLLGQQLPANIWSQLYIFSKTRRQKQKWVEKSYDRIGQTI